MIVVVLLIANQGFSQKFFTKEGHISFFSSTPLENIEANNYKAVSMIDAATGQMEFAVLMKAFEFQRSLMQEHFNENYIESDKYPQATFKGKIENMDAVNMKKDGDYEVKVKGNLTVHGVTREVEVPGKLRVKDGKIVAGNSTFNVVPQDYKIEIPSLVKEKIAKEIKVMVDMSYQEFNH